MSPSNPGGAPRRLASFRMTDLGITLAAGAALLCAGPAGAHVSIQPQTAPAGAYQVLRFGVGHGCEAQGTTQLRLEMPPGLGAARPQPKPGWKLTVERQGETVTAIVWRGALPADQFDEFIVLVKLPPDAAPLAFPAIQSCGKTAVRWAEPTPPGGPRPSHPAPVLTLVPVASPAASHDHHR
ncbi:MAG: YcnI family protein [Phenylobacterium sp.]|uniref:YcnI family copper-binding membrane protein n=1 Tax=Phenylobacterium sp. TaxID=1871053 RepID=UPI001A612920|nr:YcnI family protein [Phenylobacterium sp.]MBL8772550.1 YcnI family protein [Phenylobacterium sp.]